MQKVGEKKKEGEGEQEKKEKEILSLSFWQEGVKSEGVEKEKFCLAENEWKEKEEKRQREKWAYFPLPFLSSSVLA